MLIPKISQQAINNMPAISLNNTQIYNNPHTFLNQNISRSLKIHSYEDELKGNYFIVKVQPSINSDKRVEFIASVYEAEKKEDRYSSIITLSCPNTAFTNGQINSINNLIAGIEQQISIVIDNEISSYENYKKYHLFFKNFVDHKDDFAPTIKFWFLAEVFFLKKGKVLSSEQLNALRYSAYSDIESINFILTLLDKELSYLIKQIDVLISSARNSNMNEGFYKKLETFKLQASDKKVIRTVLDRMNNQSNYQERPKDEEYINHIMDLPLDNYTSRKVDLLKIRDHLDATHYGMKECKRYLLEHMLYSSRDDIETKGTVLCLVGEPGTGKTSISQALASCLDTDLLKIALGGVSDESEIRGHSRTYYGSQPGRLVRELKRAKSMSPVIILDEIDKLGTSFKGNPADALLELLDPEQNHSFYERYLGLRIDLSKVFWICTANYIENIPAPLLSRLNIVKIPSYTLDEKRIIMKNFTIPKFEKSFKSTYRLEEDLLEYMLKEASDIRQLGNNIEKLCKSVDLDRHFDPTFKDMPITLVYYRNRFEEIKKINKNNMGFGR